ncbi:MAG: endonuclease MutS2 [Ruminococcaceae bacterium]|nr:endonuclease MutS2 [Oscillospiraceae bacterium]
MQVENTVNSSGVFVTDSFDEYTRKGFEKAFVSLEFDKIRQMLCDCTSVDGAKKILSALQPSVSLENIRYMQKQTTEAKQMSATKGAPSFGGVRDISNSLERCEKGAPLNMGELLQIADVLRSARSVAEYFGSYKGAESFCLNDVAGKLTSNKFLEELITTSIVSEDVMADNASPELYDIRRKIRSASNRIRENLQKYVAGGGSKFLQENIVTTRNGRFVIPVKSEYRNEIKGLVHDTSATGSTLFVEPMSVVEANNEIRVLGAKEEAEIERILYNISGECSRFSGALRANYENLCLLAAVFAKAELSYRMEAEEPVMSKKPYVELLRARHPLLDKEKVVPIDVVLGKKYTLLVITGPNTGGKTVTLKTVGLLAMMAQCGLHIPAKDGSTLPVFDSILADIGDEQSIEQSLSTFSAHMVNIVSILKKITADSLVLFDELGAGTDPLEGAALAESILETVRKKGCLCAATTHYAELKAYALSTEGVSNASCEFDVETLRPTYRLMIGLPGKSNAFAIAERLGIPPEIITDAKENMTGETLRFESLIDELETQKSYYENEKQKAVKLRAELSEMHKKTREERERFNKRLEAESERAQKQARSLVEQARASADYIFAELEKVKKQKDSEKFAEALAQTRQDVRSKLKEAGGKLSVVPERIEEEYVLPRPLKKGDTVTLKDIRKTGTVLSVDGDNVTVQAGIIKTKTKASNLILEEIAATPEKNVKMTKAPRTAMNVSTEIDVRGMIGDDAWFAVDKYLDEAVLANLSQVTIIHGKGTGALRAALSGFLRKDKRVKSMRSGMFGEGDSGVTVVTLK